MGTSHWSRSASCSVSRATGSPRSPGGDHANRARPHVCGEQAKPGQQNHDPEHQMDPPPRRGAELKDVLGAHDIEVTIRNRHDPRDNPPHPGHDHHDPGERRPTNRPTTRLIVHQVVSHGSGPTDCGSSAAYKPLFAPTSSNNPVLTGLKKEDERKRPCAGRSSPDPFRSRPARTTGHIRTRNGRITTYWMSLIHI